MKPVLLWVEWVDCSFFSSGWITDEELLDKAHRAAVTNISVGFKTKSENGFLILAADWQRDEKHMPWARTIAIPERSIVRKRRIPYQ